MRHFIFVFLFACNGNTPTTEQITDTNTYCSVVKESDNSITITCPDGSTANIEAPTTEYINNTTYIENTADVPEITADTYYGDITLYNEFDVWLINHYKHVNGYLNISIDADLPNLESIKLGLYIYGNNVTQLSLPALSNIGTDLTIFDTSLTDIDIGNGNLNVGGDALVDSNDSLRSCDIQSWLGTLTINGTAAENNNLSCF